MQLALRQDRVRALEALQEFLVAGHSRHKDSPSLVAMVLGMFAGGAVKQDISFLIVRLMEIHRTTNNPLKN